MANLYQHESGESAVDETRTAVDEAQAVVEEAQAETERAEAVQDAQDPEGDDLDRDEDVPPQSRAISAVRATRTLTDNQLEMLTAAVQNLTVLAGEVQRANEQLDQEIDALDITLGRAPEPEHDDRLAELEQELGDARRQTEEEKRRLYQEQDAFISELIEDHSRELQQATLERQSLIAELKGRHERDVELYKQLLADERSLAKSRENEHRATSRELAHKAYRVRTAMTLLVERHAWEKYRIRELEAQMLEAERRVQLAEQERDGQRSSFLQMESRLREAEQSRMQLGAELDSLRAQLSDAKAELGQVREQLAQATAVQEHQPEAGQAAGDRPLGDTLPLDTTAPLDAAASDSPALADAEDEENTKPFFPEPTEQPVVSSVRATQPLPARGAAAENAAGTEGDQDYPAEPFPLWPGTGDPGTGDPGTGDPGTGDPGTGDPGTGDKEPQAGVQAPGGQSSGHASGRQGSSSASSHSVLERPRVPLSRLWEIGTPRPANAADPDED